VTSTPVMLRQLRHDVWATDRLITHCRGLAPQFVHHGNDHHARITTTLSASGIEPPDLEVWPLATEMGASREGTP
jgi:hypothetical protein